MARDPDLLYVLLALQLGHLTRDQLLEAAAAWLEAPTSSLASHLEGRGLLTPDSARALRSAVEARVRDPGGTLDPTLPPPSTPGRYRLINELGRGGLGRVVEAWDESLRRGVAIKVLHGRTSPDLQERFAREARLAARLEHPSIVPIHDFGTLEDGGGGRTVFLCMKRIRGRDLEKVLWEVARGAGSPWTRARLLRVFQDACLGMAFAHDRGVIHRDLKPSNVMIGDYGETLIVDWGLAKELAPGAIRDSGAIEGEVVDAPPPVPGPARDRAAGDSTRLTGAEPSEGAHARTLRAPSDGDLRHSWGANLTYAGDILGTPAYMSPEQAEGRVDEIDARSDIWSLGAILYEILALRPPFEGNDVSEVIAAVREGTLVPPSVARAARDGRDPVPPELDAICLHALERSRDERYQSARALHDDIQLFLEGVQQRERDRAAADACVARAAAAADRRARLRGEAASARAEARRLEIATPALAGKEDLWAAQDRADALERGVAEAFADALESLARALEHERGHEEARRRIADLAWEGYLEAEEAGDAAGALFRRRLVEQHHGGRFEAHLRDEGTLSVRTLVYDCDCLRRGRLVHPAELQEGGFDLCTGRSLAGTPGASGVGALELRDAITLRVHGRWCAATELPGADVWLYRHEEAGRRLIPVTPALDGPPGPQVPQAALDALWETGSPHRPRGPGHWLGRTPVAPRALPRGSWLLVVVRPGHAPARVPVNIPRNAAAAQDITLFRQEEIPPGMVPVAEGEFTFQGDPGNPYAGPAESRILPAYFVARHPVTCREYAAFLNATRDPGRAPRTSADGPPLWAGPPFAVPDAANGRHPSIPGDWDPDWPVTAVSWEDALSCTAWMRARTGFCLTLPTSAMWEKAARGPDRRLYPWGRFLDPRWCNGDRSHSGGPRPAPVHAFPDDESPYGVRGLAGNTRDACLDDAGADWPGRRWFKGGTWARPEIESRASDRTAVDARTVIQDFGFRLAALSRLAGIPGRPAGQ